MKKSFGMILIFLFFFLSLVLNQCSYPVRKESALRESSFFLFMEGGIIPVEVLEENSLIDKNWRELRKNQDELGVSDRNNYYVLCAKKGKIDIAELGFLELQRERPGVYQPFLNLVHLYYILGEYTEAKKAIYGFVTKNRIGLDTFRQKILIYLDDIRRYDEKGMFLEAVATVPGYELYSWEELAKYFLYNKDYDSTEYYLQKILESVPFHEGALLTMAEICLDSGRWRELVDYGKALNLTPNNRIKSYYLIGKGYFESRDYAQAVSWLNQAPESEKSRFDFLLLWRDSLILENPNQSLLHLRKYFHNLQKNGLQKNEEEILPTLNPYGKQIWEGFLR